MEYNYKEKLEKITNEIELVLSKSKLTLNESEITSWDIADYILNQRQMGEDYSIEDWINDTKINYPECFNG